MKTTKSMNDRSQTGAGRLLVKRFLLATVALAAMGAIGSNCATAPEDLAGSVAYRQLVGVNNGEEITLVTETSGETEFTAEYRALVGDEAEGLSIDEALAGDLHARFAAVGYRVGIRLATESAPATHLVSRDSFNALGVGTNVALDPVKLTLRTETSGTHQLLF